MKKTILIVLSLFLVLPAMRGENIGVPAESEDVMLQVFYWNSYTSTKYGRTKWIDLLKDTSVINANFDLVWFPPSAFGDGGNGKGGVGYTHRQLSNQDSDWGTKTKLAELIGALHRGNTKVIADIVINHRGNKDSWCSFYPDYFGSYGTYQLTSEHICRNDEVNTNSSAGSCKGKATGANDTGSNFDGARDLDHTNEYVQDWAKAYVQWMINTMKYDGFRYDMTLGYHGRYLSMYNEASNPYLSVSELWDNINVQITHLKATNYNTMIFDFPLKYQLHEGIVKGSYGKLKNPANSLRGTGYAKYAVTFLDNHDTFERDGYGNNQYGGQNCDLSKASVKANILQAYAYILMMPGVPCVFWPHWKSYQEEINALIALRKAAGVHSESEVSDETSSQYNYEAKIQGHKSMVILRLGSKRSTEVPEGYYLAADGNHYSVYLQNGTGIEDVSDRQPAGNGQKFIKDGRLYIRCGERVYDAVGNLVEK